MDDDLQRPNDRAGLARLVQPLLADPPVATAPVGEIRRRAARRARQRAAALAVIVVAVLAVGGTALARSGREGPTVRVGTTPAGQVLPDVRIYLDAQVTPAQIAALQAALLADPTVVTLTYSDVDAAYAQFRCYFAGQPDLLESVQPHDLPREFGVDVIGGAAAARVLFDRFEHAAGVKAESFRPGLEDKIGPSVTLEVPQGASTGSMKVLRAPKVCPITATTLR